MASEFGKWLLPKLEERGWNQADLARRVGCTRAAINAVVNGTRGPGNSLLLAIARTLLVAPSEVFEAAGVLPAGDDSIPGFSDWVYLFLSLSDEEREDLLSYARYKAERAAAKERSATG